MIKRYRPLSDFLANKFGLRVFRVSLDAGLSCPNRDGSKGIGGCSYCNMDTLATRSHIKGMDIGKQLDCGIKYMRDRRAAEKFIAYFQTNSNTYAPVKMLRELYMPAIKEPEVVAIAIATRPDCVEEGVVSLLHELSHIKFIWVELGLQSANKNTLLSINRQHTLEDFISAAERLTKRGIPVCAHIILGLPGESCEDMVQTARFLNELKIWGVKIHPLLINKDTTLEARFRNGNIKPLELGQYAGLVVDFLEELSEEIIIHCLSGSTMKRFLVAPEWGADRFTPPRLIRSLLQERDTHQGAKHGIGTSETRLTCQCSGKSGKI